MMDESDFSTDYRKVKQILENLVNKSTVSDEKSGVKETENEIPPTPYKEVTSALNVLPRYNISSNVEDDTFNI